MRYIACMMMVLLGLCSTFITGCISRPEPPVVTQEENGRIQFTGTVYYVTLEGGGWIVKAGDRTFQPLNLPQGFKQQGLRVRIVARPRPEVATTLMLGEVIEIITIQRREGLIF